VTANRVVSAYESNTKINCQCAKGKKCKDTGKFKAIETIEDNTIIPCTCFSPLWCRVHIIILEGSIHVADVSDVHKKIAVYLHSHKQGSAFGRMKAS
jgi:hypothetical protein